MGDEHLNTISAMESDELIKSCVENLVSNPSESEGEKGCDVLACFTTFSNVLFDGEYEFNSVNDQSCSNEDVPEKIFSNPLLLYDNSSSCPPKEFVSENSNAEIESFSPSPIPIKDSDSFMEEIDLNFTPDDPIPSSIKNDDDDSKRDNLFLERLLHDDPIPLPGTLDFSYDVRVFLPFFTYPSLECKSDRDVIFHLLPYGPMNSGSSRACDSVFKNKALRGRHLMLIIVQYSWKLEDSSQRILSSKSSFPQLQLGIMYANLID
nr:hypothetical protein [Tanacetum cinerariifolium]